MICPECQTELPEGSRFCKECGQKIDHIFHERGADGWVKKYEKEFTALQ